ncbi:MAG: hypothetical protein ACRDL7_06430, partial [Gaiellaceae bacterium]
MLIYRLNANFPNPNPSKKQGAELVRWRATTALHLNRQSAIPTVPRDEYSKRPFTTKLRLLL